MKQQFVHLTCYHVNDLVDKIANEIESRNEEDLILVDLKFSNIEENDSDCHAYLLFNEVTNG
jgi:hypothetical protein